MHPRPFILYSRDSDQKKRLAKSFSTLSSTLPNMNLSQEDLRMAMGAKDAAADY